MSKLRVIAFALIAVLAVGLFAAWRGLVVADGDKRRTRK